MKSGPAGKSWSREASLICSVGRSQSTRTMSPSKQRDTLRGLNSESLNVVYVRVFFVIMLWSVAVPFVAKANSEGRSSILLSPRFPSTRRRLFPSDNRTYSNWIRVWKISGYSLNLRCHMEGVNIMTVQ